MINCTKNDTIVEIYEKLGRLLFFVIILWKELLCTRQFSKSVYLTNSQREYIPETNMAIKENAVARDSDPDCIYTK